MIFLKKDLEQNSKLNKSLATPVEWAKRPPPVVRTLSNIAHNSLGWRSPHWVRVVAVAVSKIDTFL